MYEHLNSDIEDNDTFNHMITNAEVGVENDTETQPIVEPETGNNTSENNQLHRSSGTVNKRKPRNLNYNLFRRSHSRTKIGDTGINGGQGGEKLEPVKDEKMTQSQFRRNLKMSKEQILHDVDGKCFRLVEIPMNGDCGFAAIAKSINISNDFHSDENTNLKLTKKRAPSTLFGIPKRNTKKGIYEKKRWRQGSGAEKEGEKFMTPADVRRAMSIHILKEKTNYLSDKDGYGCFYTENDYNRLLNDVVKSGISGHWLGSILGNMEHVILSHALQISIFLYQFDLQKQVVRKFEEAKVKNPRHEVFLFFTGPGTNGHYDILISLSQNEKMDSQDDQNQLPAADSTAQNVLGSSSSGT